jgi:hypothetical protein
MVDMEPVPTISSISVIDFIDIVLFRTVCTARSGRFDWEGYLFTWLYYYDHRPSRDGGGN